MQVIASVDSELRSDPRTNVFLMATLYTTEGSYPVRVRNLSLFGALLESGELPEKHVPVLLKRGSLSVRGELAWQRSKYCGVRFKDSIDVAEWVKRSGPDGQQKVDAAIAAFRSGIPAKAQLAVVSADQAPAHDSIAAELLRICERIAALPDMSLALGEELIKIEAAAVALKSVPGISR